MGCWLGLRALETFYFCKVMKKNIEMIFAKNFAKNYQKKIILGTSDAWSMRPQHIISKIVRFLLTVYFIQY